MSESVTEIAARYGAAVRPDLQVRKVGAGVSGLPPLVWDDRKGLIYATKPDLQKLSYSGRPPKPVTLKDGRTWRSMGEMARHLGVTLATVSNAVKRGTVEALVQRRSGVASE